MSTTTKLFALTHPTGGLLPQFTPGSHIVVHMRDGGKVYRNSYSLINGGYDESLAYFIGVQLAPNSKGGSKYLHEKVARGGELTISVPANYFPTAESAVKHLLIAGGIGITPLLAHRTHLKLLEQRVELHYTFRNAEIGGLRPLPGVPERPERSSLRRQPGTEARHPRAHPSAAGGDAPLHLRSSGTDGRGDQRGGSARLAGRVDSRRALRRRDPQRAMSRSRRSAKMRARRSRSARPSTCWIVSSTPASRFRSAVAPAVAAPAKSGFCRARSSIAIRFFPPPSGRKARRCWPASRADRAP